MIDLHCHIIPEVDDGSKNIKESLEIAYQLQNAGFRTVFATPHVIEGRNMLSCDRIIEGTNRVNQALQKEGLNLKVLPGAECYIFPELAKWVSVGKIMTLGNMKKYILVELPMLEVPSYTEKIFFDLQVMGITPVLAHPERNKELSDTPERLVDWVRKGVLLQLNLRSIEGRYGEGAAHLAQVLLKNQLIHGIGSDAHRSVREHSYENSLEALRNIVGNQMHDRITLGLPQQILDGEKIEVNIEVVKILNKNAKEQGMFKRIIANFKTKI